MPASQEAAKTPCRQSFENICRRISGEEVPPRKFRKNKASFGVFQAFSENNKGGHGIVKISWQTFRSYRKRPFKAAFDFRAAGLYSTNDDNAAKRYSSGCVFAREEPNVKSVTEKENCCFYGKIHIEHSSPRISLWR